MDRPVHAPPNVLIVIAHWNDESTTARCLQHIAASEHPSFKTVVVDSGSTDGSGMRIQARFPWIQLVRIEQNRGHTVAANAGVSSANLSKHEYTLFLDNDAYVEKDCLEELVRALESVHAAGMACPLIFSERKPGTAWYAGGKTTIFGNARNVGMGKAWKGSRSAIVEVDFATSCVLLVRRIVIERIGMFDENLSGYSEDFDFSLRAQRAGFSILFVPDARALHGESTNIIKVAGKTFRDYYTVRNRLYIIQKYGTLFQRTIGIVCTIISYVLIIGSLHMLRGESERTKALMRGVRDFFHGRMGWRGTG